MHRLRFYVVSLALLGSGGGCFAASFDCEKARGSVETTICDDDDLSRLDDALLLTYKAVLAIVQDQSDIKTDQKRWLTKVRGRCRDDAQCLIQAYDERISALEKIWDAQLVSNSLSSSKANKSRSNVFEGNWRTCQLFKGQEICSSYTLVQQGRRVCGEWEYWATYRTYSGQLQATVHGNGEASLNLICGTPGSETSTECDNDLRPSGSWENTRGGLSICNGRLLSPDDARRCSAGPRTSGFLYFPLAAEDRKRLLRQPWVKMCLSNG